MRDKIMEVTGVYAAACGSKNARIIYIRLRQKLLEGHQYFFCRWWWGV